MSKFIDRGLSEQQSAQVEQIYTLYHELVSYDIGKRIRCSNQEAEDIKEDVFERVCRSIKNGSGPRASESTKKWLMQIVKNECLKFKETWPRRSAISLESPVSQEADEMLGDQIAANDDSPEEIAEQREIVRGLMAALRELSPRLQRVVFLYYVEEWTLGQISEKSGQTFSTVRRDRVKGIQFLQERLVD